VPPERRVGALGAIDHAHAAAPDHVEDAPGSDRLADQLDRGHGRHIAYLGGWSFEKAGRSVMPGEEGQHLVTEGRVCGAGGIHERGPIGLGYVERRLEHALGVGPRGGAAHR
jgi:hypothetical protein